MDNKLLTVSVAAYNMEKYIRDNLDSLLAVDQVDLLEIFVIDDGGSDATISIAKEYERRYPSIVHAVHKENGGYGSVQNYSIRNASGKYFKILDGDDWIDTAGLSNLMSELKKADVDAVVTNYYKGMDSNSLHEVKITKLVGQTGKIKPSVIKYPIGMWALTYKTSILHKLDISLPEHCLYTDRIFATEPFSLVESVLVLDVPVYCYRTGRDGQSVSIESRLKHLDEYLAITKRICKCSSYYPDNKYILLKAIWAYKVSIRALLLLPIKKRKSRKNHRI